MGEPLNEEWAQVLAVHPDHVELAARNASVCGGCAGRSSCGHGLLDSLGSSRRRTFTLPRSGLPADLRVGEELLVGVPQGAVFRAAACVYGLPLTGFVGAAALAPREDGPALLAACIGLALGWLLSRRLQGGGARSRLRCRRLAAGSSNAGPARSEPRTLSTV